MVDDVVLRCGEYEIILRKLGADITAASQAPHLSVLDGGRYGDVPLITRDMLSAGTGALDDLRETYCDESLVAAIYAAMRNALPLRKIQASLISNRP